MLNAWSLVDVMAHHQYSTALNPKQMRQFMFNLFIFFSKCALNLAFISSLEIL